MPAAAQGILPKLKVPPALFRRAINLWPPFLGAGIRVTRVSADYSAIDETLRLGLANRNYFGTQFGGSLFAMTDPFFALMMLHNLGPDYVVWDKAATIRYRRPGRGDVHALFRLAACATARARRAAARGAKHERVFRVTFVDRDDAVVAEVEKSLSSRRRPDASPRERAPARA